MFSGLQKIVTQLTPYVSSFLISKPAEADPARISKTASRNYLDFKKTIEGVRASDKIRHQFLKDISSEIQWIEDQLIIPVKSIKDYQRVEKMNRRFIGLNAHVNLCLMREAFPEKESIEDHEDWAIDWHALSSYGKQLSQLHLRLNLMRDEIRSHTRKTNRMIESQIKKHIGWIFWYDKRNVLIKLLLLPLKEYHQLRYEAYKDLII